MGLNIEGASIGYDSGNVQQLLNNMHEHVIQEAIDKMRDSMDGLREQVGEAWVGTSAENFMANMETDREVIQVGLEATEQALRGELNQIMQRMDEVDNNLVERR